MVLADTNLIIYATRPDYAVVANWLIQSAPACSAITRVEALGYRRLSDTEHDGGLVAGCGRHDALQN